MSISLLLAVVCGLLAGASLGAQPGVNSTLARHVAHPVQASLISFATGLLVLVVVAAMLRVFPPRFSTAIGDIPWWSWTGGAIGALVVTSSLHFSPYTGGLFWLALLITGQVVSSMLLDHFGLVGYPIHPLHPMRILGATLLLLGVLIVSRW